MTDLVEWLRAQIAEDRRIAEAATPGPWVPNAESDEVVAVDSITVADGFALSGNQLRATVRHIARWDPARVLAECDAKERIISEHTPEQGWSTATVTLTDVCGTCSDRDNAGDREGEWPCSTLRLLALPYAGGDGYQEDWRP